MRKIILLLTLLVLIALPSVVSAAYTNPNYTPYFDLGDEVHVNQSYVISNNGSTPIWAFLIMLIAGFGAFVGSLVLSPKQRNDILGYIAPLPLLISALMCTGLSGIDVVTGYGVSSQLESNAPSGVVYSHEVFYIENHIIYVNDVLAIFFVIMFFIALLNCFRVYAEYELFKHSGGINNGSE